MAVPAFGGPADGPARVQTGEAIMKLRTSLAAAGAAAVLGVTGALVLPAVASAHSASTTLKFTAVQKGTVSFGRTAQAIQDTDVNATGKTVGFDMLNVTATSPTAGSANVTVDTNGGFLYGTFNINFKTGAVTNGKVTGGTGAFTAATGTIKVKTISNTKHAVTITYSG
jgi:hypothetical protein